MYKDNLPIPTADVSKAEMKKSLNTLLQDVKQQEKQFYQEIKRKRSSTYSPEEKEQVRGSLVDNDDLRILMYSMLRSNISTKKRSAWKLNSNS